MRKGSEHRHSKQARCRHQSQLWRCRLPIYQAAFQAEVKRGHKVERCRLHSQQRQQLRHSHSCRHSHFHSEGSQQQQHPSIKLLMLKPQHMRLLFQGRLLQAMASRPTAVGQGRTQGGRVGLEMWMICSSQTESDPKIF